MWDLFRELLPVLMSVAIKNPETRQLVERLTAIGEREVERRMNETGKTRAEALAEFDEQWQKDIEKAQSLKDRPDNR